MNPIELVFRFIDAINRHAVLEIAALLTDDLLFIDSMGAELHGRGAMTTGWEAYFSMVPDYSIAASETFLSANTVVVLGTAAGTYCPDGALLPENRWRTPAAWRAVVTEDHIAVWQVFADNEPIRQLMRENHQDAG